MGIEEAAQDKVLLATAGYDHTIHFWQAHSGVCQRSFQHPTSQVNDMEIAPNRQWLAAAGFQHIRMYDILSNNPNPVVNYEGVTKNVTAVGFQEEGRWMFTGSEDNSARIWDLRTRNLQWQTMFQTNAPVNCVCLHPNQTEMYVGDQGGVIYLWDLRADHSEQQLKKPFFKAVENDVSIQSIDIDAEGTTMAAVDNKGNCHLFTLSPGGGENLNTQPSRKVKIPAHKTYALKCKFSPDSTLLATTSADCTAKLWKTADLLFCLEQNDPCTPVSPSTPPGCNLISSRDYKTEQPTCAVELKDSNQRWVWDVAFSADSQYIITASSDNLARLWSISTGEVKREYSGHSKALTSLAFKDGP